LIKSIINNIHMWWRCTPSFRMYTSNECLSIRFLITMHVCLKLLVRGFKSECRFLRCSPDCIIICDVSWIFQENQRRCFSLYCRVIAL
jgi:fumarate reductase subunit C